MLRRWVYAHQDLGEPVHVDGTAIRRPVVPLVVSAELPAGALAAGFAWDGVVSRLEGARRISDVESTQTRLGLVAVGWRPQVIRRPGGVLLL